MTDPHIIADDRVSEGQIDIVGHGLGLKHSKRIGTEPAHRVIGRAGNEQRAVGKLTKPADDQLFIADGKQIRRQGLRPVRRRRKVGRIGIVADRDTRVADNVFEIDAGRDDLTVRRANGMRGVAIKKGHGKTLNSRTSVVRGKTALQRGGDASMGGL